MSDEQDSDEGRVWRLYQGNGIEFLSFDLSDLAGVYDNSSIEADAEKIARKNADLAKRRRDSKSELRQLCIRAETPRPVKCPADLRSITL